MRVLGVTGAEVGVEEAEVLIRIFEDRRGDAMAFAWARRRRSIDVRGAEPGESEREPRAFHAFCHVSRLGELFFVGT